MSAHLQCGSTSRSVQPRPDRALRSGLDLALKHTTRQRVGMCIGAWDAGDRLAAPVDGAPVAAALRPGDAATRTEINRFVELRLDHHLPGGVDQSPPAGLEEGHKAAIQIEADALCADVDPRLSGARQDRALAAALQHDRAERIAHDAW